MENLGQTEIETEPPVQLGDPVYYFVSVIGNLGGSRPVPLHRRINSRGRAPLPGSTLDLRIFEADKALPDPSFK